MYSASSFGRVMVWKFAQCGQVRDAYSITVTGAAGSPRMRSPCFSSASVVEVVATSEPWEEVLAAGPCINAGLSPVRESPNQTAAPTATITIAAPTIIQIFDKQSSSKQYVVQYPPARALTRLIGVRVQADSAPRDGGGACARTA